MAVGFQLTPHGPTRANSWAQTNKLLAPNTSNLFKYIISVLGSCMALSPCHNSNSLSEEVKRNGSKRGQKTLKSVGLSIKTMSKGEKKIQENHSTIKDESKNKSSWWEVKKLCLVRSFSYDFLREKKAEIFHLKYITAAKKRALANLWQLSHLQRSEKGNTVPP